MCLPGNVERVLLNAERVLLNAERVSVNARFVSRSACREMPAAKCLPRNACCVSVSRRDYPYHRRIFFMAFPEMRFIRNMEMKAMMRTTATHTPAVR